MVVIKWVNEKIKEYINKDYNNAKELIIIINSVGRDQKIVDLTGSLYSLTN